MTGPTKRSRGRPALPAEERRAIRLEVAVSEREHATLTAEAARRGVAVAVLLREAGLRAARKRRVG